MKGQNGVLLLLHKSQPLLSYFVIRQPTSRNPALWDCIRGFFNPRINNLKRCQPKTVPSLRLPSFQVSKPADVLIEVAECVRRGRSFPFRNDHFKPPKYQALCIRCAAVWGLILDDKGPRCSHVTVFSELEIRASGSSYIVGPTA